MAFKRKIYQQMLDWKNEPRKNSALLIEGARRVGKTTIVKEFAKNEYPDYLYIDFTYASDDLKGLFKKVDPNRKEVMDQFFADLFLLMGKAVQPGALIVFDEIEFCNAARQDIKAFVQDGRFDYIETGSLISIRGNTEDIQIPSEERRIEMHPMDFEEFCCAFNEESKCELLRNIYVQKLPLGAVAHQRMMDDLRLYLALGGMPKVVSLYQETQSFLRCDKEKRDILKLYRDDLRKHDNQYGTICLPIYESMLPALRSWSGRVKTTVKSERQQARYLRSLQDLEDSKIVNAVKRVADLSFGANMPDELNFKLYPADTGLMLCQLLQEGEESVESAYKSIRFGKMSGSNFGLLYECLVCQSVFATGAIPFYHVFEIQKGERSSRYEIDFAYRKEGKLRTLEVKSTLRFEAPSIQRLKEKYPQLKMERFVVSPKPLKRDGDITYLPIYMSFLL